MLVLFTDTDTDITPIEAKHYGYKLISMPYSIDDQEIKPYVDFQEFDYHKFYDTLRGGVLPKTSAISPLAYRDYFEPEFKAGNDILYVHFSKAMSGTFNAMNVAVEELLEEYPERKFYTIDTLGITILSYNIVKEIGELHLQGKNIDELLAWADQNVNKFATYFFADNLNFFAKSGRISNFSKIMGNFIGVKPIIYMDANGTMTNIGKEKGANKAMKRLLSCFEELSDDIYNHHIIIGHTDALDKAHKLGEMLIEKYGQELKIDYVVVNPTAGSHCGPDTVGICFYAKHK